MAEIGERAGRTIRSIRDTVARAKLYRPDCKDGNRTPQHRKFNLRFYAYRRLRKM